MYNKIFALCEQFPQNVNSQFITEWKQAQYTIFSASCESVLAPKIFIPFPFHLTSLMNIKAQFKAAARYLNTHSFYFADEFLMFKNYSYNIIWKLYSFLYSTNSQKLYVYDSFHISLSFWQTSASKVCMCVCVYVHARVYTKTNGAEWIQISISQNQIAYLKYTIQLNPQNVSDDKHKTYPLNIWCQKEPNLAFKSYNIFHLKRWLNHRVVSDIMRVLRRCRWERSKPLEYAATLCVTIANRAEGSNCGNGAMVGPDAPSSSGESFGLPESSWIIMSCHSKWVYVQNFSVITLFFTLNSHFTQNSQYQNNRQL